LPDDETIVLFLVGAICIFTAAVLAVPGLSLPPTGSARAKDSFWLVAGPT